MDKTALGSINTEVDDKGIATITFFHPSHNSLPGLLLKKFEEAIVAAGQNDVIKVIIKQKL